MSNPRLICIREPGGGDPVIFKVRPEVTVSSSANYIEVSEIRQAASILVYIGSPSRTFTVNAKLVSRTKKEADKNFEILHRLRSWRMPTKNTGRLGADDTSDSPPALELLGYGTETIGNFRAIRCVMTALNEDFPVDVDYVTCSNTSEMPIIMTVSISLKEIHKPEDLDKFDFNEFKSGKLPEW